MTNSRRATFAGALALAACGLFLEGDGPLVLEFSLAEAFEKGIWYTTALSAPAGDSRSSG